MGTFGIRLRRERESRHLRLVDVSKATRVGVHHLAALEHEDFDALPNDVFVKGYLRVYAECLKLDADQLVAEYLDEARSRRPERSTNGDDPVVSEMARILAPKGARRPRLRPGFLAAAVGAVLLLLLVVWLWPGSGDGGESQLATVEPPTGKPAGAHRAAAAAEASAKPASAEDGPPAARAPALARPPQEREPTEPAPPPSRPAPPPDRKPDAGIATLTVPESGVGTGIRNRQLVGQADRFSPGTRVYYWTRVLGASKGDRVHHVWLHEGRKIASTTLELGGRHWRTQSRKTLWKPGRWAVEARDDAGNVLARSEFRCAGAD